MATSVYNWDFGLQLFSDSARRDRQYGQRCLVLCLEYHHKLKDFPGYWSKEEKWQLQGGEDAEQKILAFWY